MERIFHGFFFKNFQVTLHWFQALVFSHNLDFLLDQSVAWYHDSLSVVSVGKYFWRNFLARKIFPPSDVVFSQGSRRSPSAKHGCHHYIIYALYLLQIWTKFWWNSVCLDIQASIHQVERKIFTAPIGVFIINHQFNCDWLKFIFLQNHTTVAVYHNCISLDFMSKTANFCQEIPF